MYTNIHACLTRCNNVLYVRGVPEDEDDDEDIKEDPADQEDDED